MFAYQDRRRRPFSVGHLAKFLTRQQPQALQLAPLYINSLPAPLEGEGLGMRGNPHPEQRAQKWTHI